MEKQETPAAAAPPRQGAGPEHPSETSKSGSLLSKYTEQVMAALISFVLFGVLIWAITHFSNKIDNLERNIAAHHGPQWDQIDHVVRVEKLRGTVDGLDRSLKKDVGVRLHAIERWIQASDAWIAARRSQGYEAYAHLTTRAPRDEAVALVNRAHASGGSHFEIGDTVIVARTDSPLAQQVRVTISGAYSDLDNTDVLVQLGPEPAELLGLTEIRGKIRVSVRRTDADPGAPSYRKELRDYYQEAGLPEPVADAG